MPEEAQNLDSTVCHFDGDQLYHVNNGRRSAAAKFCANFKIVNTPKFNSSAGYELAKVYNVEFCLRRAANRIERGADIHCFSYQE